MSSFVKSTAIAAILGVTGVVVPMTLSAQQMGAMPQLKPKFQVECQKREIKFELRERNARLNIVRNSTSGSPHVRWEVRADHAGVKKAQLIKRSGTTMNLVGKLSPGKATFDVIASRNSHLEGGRAELHVWLNAGCGQKDVKLMFQVGLPRVPSAS
jgi:hypothetical protein